LKTTLLATDSPGALSRAEAEACKLLEAGEPIALPTETVYGLAADALSPEAAAKIFEAKERPSFDPLICHLPNRVWLQQMANIPKEDERLVRELTSRFWPGPLTLVLPRREIVPDIVTSGLDTVAVRMSAHPIFSAILRRFDKPLAAPSANRFGRISPTTAAHVQAELDGRIPLIVDGGPTQHGIESTIVTVEKSNLRLLRAGPITPDELAEAWMAACQAERHIPSKIDVQAFFVRMGISPDGAPLEKEDATVEAPGQLQSHYAPRTPLRLLPRGAHVRFYGESVRRIGSLSFQEKQPAQEFAVQEVLSTTGDLREAAATLFAKMRRLDEAGLDLIVVEPVPENGLGIAIMDRLRKAAAAFALSAENQNK
jgi:L-threonylcarbamoyladenylate synthase